MKLRTITKGWVFASVLSMLIYGFYVYTVNLNTPTTEWERFTQMFTYWKPWVAIIWINGLISVVWYKLKLRR